MGGRSLVAGALALIFATLPPSAALGDTRWAEQSFGGRFATVDLGPGHDSASGLAVQRDGRVVVVGTANDRNEGGRTSDIAVLRFLPDGSLDSTFGNGGKVLIDRGGREVATAVVVQPDGTIVVAGEVDTNGFGQMAVLRLDATGRLDPTFQGGVVVLYARSGSGRAVALQPDGKIVVAGYGVMHNDVSRRVSDFLVARLSTDGTLDESFGDRGAVLTNVGAGWEPDDFANAVVVQPDGRILVAGKTSNPSFFTPVNPSSPALVRYTSDGTLDGSFGTGGRVVGTVPGEIFSVALHRDGGIVAGGDVQFTSGVRSRSFGVSRYQSNGTIDTGFGAGGTTFTHAPPTGDASHGNSFAGGVVLDARGGVVAAGGAFGSTSLDLALVRYNAAGAVDAGFGRAGWIKADVGERDMFHAVGLLPDRRIVAAGRATRDGNDQIVLAVYPPVDQGSSAAAAWGWNPVGEVGDGSTTDRAVPVPVAILRDAQMASGGVFHNVALDDAGSVYTWGWNGVGQLGDGTLVERHAPVRVGGLASMASVAAGYYHSLAVRGGDVWAWGWNPVGQLGDGTTTDRTRPVRVAGLTDVVSVAGGALHSLAVRTDGSVWSWGWNGVGQLGDGSTVDRATPAPVPGLTGIVAVAAGAYHSVALSSNGSMWAWGWNGLRQLGWLTPEDKHSPVWLGMAMTGVAVAAGAYHTVGLANDGSVWAWGHNGVGQIGDGSTVTATRLVPVRGLPESKAVAAGVFHTLALGVDGRVRAWGWNAVGQLGNGSTADTWSPVLTAGPPGAAAIAAGAFHSLAP